MIAGHWIFSRLAGEHGGVGSWWVQGVGLGVQGFGFGMGPDCSPRLGRNCNRDLHDEGKPNTRARSALLKDCWQKL